MSDGLPLDPSETRTDEERLGPPLVDIVSVGLGSLAGIVAGFIGGLFAFIGSYVFVGMTRTSDTAIYPYLLSLIAFFAIVLTVSANLVMQRMLFPDKYRGGGTGFGQSLLFCIFAYACVTPLYLYMGSAMPQNILVIFAIHVLLGVFGATLVLEIVANYRYALLGVYGSFLGLFASTILTVVYFSSVTVSAKALYVLLGLMIVITGVTTFVRLLFEWAYSAIHRSTGIDPLGDIFSAIEAEERAAERAAVERLTRFPADGKDS